MNTQIFDRIDDHCPVRILVLIAYADYLAQYLNILLVE